MEIFFQILALAITGWITFEVVMARVKKIIQKIVEEELARRAVPNLDEVRALTDQVKALTDQLTALRRS